MSKLKYVYIEITTSCNLTCKFCPSSKIENRRFMSFEEFKMIIDQIKDYTEGIYLHILGEPLLNKEIFKMIDYAAKYVKVNLTTNGWLIKNYLAELIDSNLTKINISLQSLYPLNKEEQEEYFINLSKLVTSKKKKLGINIREWNDKNKEVELIDHLNHLLEKFQLLSYPNVRLNVADEFRWPNINDPINPINTKCLGGKEQIGIKVNGDVVICCLDYLNYSKLGNIFTDGFDKIYHSELLKLILSNWQMNKPYLEICKKCTYRNRFIQGGIK